VVGKIDKQLFIVDGKPEVRDGLTVSWTFDERINDGFYCASSLQIAQRIVEDPDKYASGVPAALPAKTA
jgi:pyruvate/2-oxoglutarate dehydrogenase complex dihydrolipoamide acyltransferase (E2) component